MKQYTTTDQTAKLIELGFEKPKGYGYIGKEEDSQVMQIFNSSDYAIGELISFCPKRLSIWDLEIAYDSQFERWLCFLNPDTQCGIATELVDALYNLLIKLKEERII